MADLTRTTSDQIAALVRQIAGVDNLGVGMIGALLAERSPAYRARVIERLASMISAIAEHQAAENTDA